MAAWGAAAAGSLARGGARLPTPAAGRSGRGGRGAALTAEAALEGAEMEGIRSEGPRIHEEHQRAPAERLREATIRLWREMLKGVVQRFSN